MSCLTGWGTVNVQEKIISETERVVVIALPKFVGSVPAVSAMSRTVENTIVAAWGALPQMHGRPSDITATVQRQVGSGVVSKPTGLMRIVVDEMTGWQTASLAGLRQGLWLAENMLDGLKCVRGTGKGNVRVAEEINYVMQAVSAFTAHASDADPIWGRAECGKAGEWSSDRAAGASGESRRLRGRRLHAAPLRGQLVRRRVDVKGGSFRGRLGGRSRR